MACISQVVTGNVEINGTLLETSVACSQAGARSSPALCVNTNDWLYFGTSGSGPSLTAIRKGKGYSLTQAVGNWGEFLPDQPIRCVGASCINICGSTNCVVL